MWDYNLLLWLNRLVALRPSTFFAALILTDRVPWVLTALGLLAAWFSGDQDRPAEPGTRLFDSRRMVLLIVISAMLAFALARPVAHYTARPRPLVLLPLQAPIAPAAWDSIVAAMGQDGAFPSDHAAFWTALTIGLWLLDRRLGFLSLVGTLFFSSLRVAVGYHYPTDILGGIGLGGLSFLAVYALREKISWLTKPTVLFFDNYPALAYPLGFLLLYDLTQRMAFFFGFLSTVFGLTFSR